MQTEMSPLESDADPQIRRRTIAALAIVYIAWSSTYLAIRIGVAGVPPMLFAAARFFLAAGFLWIVCLKRKRYLRPADWWPAIVSGALLFGGGNGPLVWAEETVPSNVTALMVALVPAFLAILEWLRPAGGAPRLSAIMGIFVGLLGMALLIAPGARVDSAVGIAGILALIGSDLAWAIGTFHTKHRLGRSEGIAVVTVQLTAGGVVLLPVALARGEFARIDLAAIPARTWVAIVYLAVFGSLLGYTAYAYVLRVSTPLRASTASYVNPAFAVVLGWIALGESLTLRQGLGAIVILLGVFFMSVPSTVLLRLGRSVATHARSFVMKARDVGNHDTGAPIPTSTRKPMSVPRGQPSATAVPRVR